MSYPAKKGKTMNPFHLVLVLVLLSLHLSSLAAEKNITTSIKDSGLVDAETVVPGLKVDLKYSSTDNFLKKDVYGDLSKCYLQSDAAQMLKNAAGYLAAIRPGHTFLAYDCARPVSVQHIMWQAVIGTKQQSYVANPNTLTGSIHNYGCAVDLTIVGEKGSAIDMGSAFDSLGAKAQPRHEIKLLRQNQLSAEQVVNRTLLRLVMVKAGFYPISNEWWHFNCATKKDTRKKYKKIP